MNAPVACAFRDGVMHDHGNDRCHEASRKAGAIEALRAAAVEVGGLFIRGYADDVMDLLNAIADQIERSTS